MATLNVVPEVWAREIVEQLPLYTAFGDVANILTGEINRKGDQLHIIGADAVSVAAYPASDNITYVNAADTDAYSIGFGHIVDNSTGATKVVSVENLGADKVDLLFTAAATPVGIVTHNQPWVWAASDYMAFWIQYEAA